MTAATSITNRRISQEGLFTLWEIKGTLTNGETLDIPTADPITTSSTVSVVAVNNITDGTTFGIVSAPYTSASRLFTITDAGASDDDVRVIYMVEN